MQLEKAGLAVILVSLALTGCWESSDVTLHEAGKYMGSKDPLSAQAAGSRDEALRKRFELVQLDR